MNNLPYARLNQLFYDNLAPKFIKSYREKPAWYYHHRVERDKFISYVTSGTILDAGCGSGVHTPFLADNKNVKLIGIDISEKQLENARKINPSITFIQMDINFINFEPDTFTGIWANASLLHIAPIDMDKVLERFKIIMKSGGVFYLSFKVSEAVKNQHEFQQVDSVTFYYPVTDLVERLKKLGFEILENYEFDEQQRRPLGRAVMWGVIFAKKS